MQQYCGLRIIVELKDKFISQSNYDLPLENDQNNKAYNDANTALKLLGFNIS